MEFKVKRPVDQSRHLSKPLKEAAERHGDTVIVITIDANKPLDRRTVELLRQFVPIGRIK